MKTTLRHLRIPTIARLIIALFLGFLLKPCYGQNYQTDPSYFAPINPFDLYGRNWYECTRYAWGRAREKTGMSLTFTQSTGRHGGEWGRLVTSNFARGTTPQPNSIIVWRYGTYGHVAFVESVSGDTITISEANWASPTDGRYKGTIQLSRRTWMNRGAYVFSTFIYLTPPAPSALWVSSLSSNAVSLAWLGAPGVSQYRIHISNSASGWNAVTGWDPYEQRYPTSSVPVNYGGSSASYTWYQGAAGSASGPQPGMTYWYSVRQNTALQGASLFSAPASFTVPYPVGTPSMSLSTTSLSRTVTQYSSPSPSSFTIRNSGSGTLNYSISSNASWMSVSPSTGNSIGETDTINVNFNTSGYSPQTLTGRLTISGGSAGTQSIVVSLSITGIAVTPADDHGNYQWNATSLPRYGSVAGSIERGGDEDMFQVYISSYGYVTFYSTSPTAIDTYGHLYDSYGRQLTSDDDSNGNWQFRLSAYLSPGYYYIKVRGYSTATTGNYRVYVQ